ncbi:hypothetical protein B0H65DRAFT_577188, partial [Neurospora tetraspora]
MPPSVTEASNGLDSSGRALTRPEESNTTRKSHPARGIAELVLLHFASASSLLISSMSPGTDDHGKQAEMAWSSKLLRDKTVAQALAVVQVLQLAQQRLRTLPPGPKLATVQIFTGALNVLREIALNNNTWSASRSPTPHLELLRSVQSMMFEHAHKLGEIANVEVDLHLYWLPSKSRLESQQSAKRIALKCRLHDGEQNMFTLGGEPRPAAEIPPPVYLAPDVEHALVHKNKNHKKKLEKKSAAATVPITSHIGYQDSWYGQSYDPCPEPYVCSFSDPEDYYDSELEVHNSIEASPEPSHPSNPEPYSSEPPPMGSPPDMVSDIPFPRTNKPMWWRDLGPARPTITSETEEEQDMLEEHELEQCIRFMEERRALGYRNESVLEHWQEVYIKELRLMAPENPLVRSHEAKRARINCLQEKICLLREEINKKAKEFRHLARDQPFLFSGS